MHLNTEQLTTINRARVDVGLPDITLAEANDQVKYLPADVNPDFLMGWNKGEPAPETPEDAANRYEAYRRAQAEHTAAVAVRAAEDAKTVAAEKELLAAAAVEDAELAKATAVAL